MVSIEKHKINPNKKIVDDLKLQIIYMPLESTLGYKYSPIVKVGEYVYVGQTLAVNKVADLSLKSSVSGTIVGIQEKYIANGNLVKCFVIENDFKEKHINKVGKRKNISNYSKDEFIYMLKECGISGLGGSDYPTYIKYDIEEKIHYLIVNAAECESYTSCDSALMYHNSEEILEAIDAIMEIMDIDKAYIAISENNTKVIKQFLKNINTYPNIKLYGLLDVYPSGWDRALINEILGVTYDKEPSSLGIVVNNVATIYAIYEMLKFNKPVTERIITIAGAGVKKEANYKVKIGSNFSEIMLKTDGYSNIKNAILVAGDAMRGKAIPTDELIITKDLRTILVLPDNTAESTDCIKCGKCSEVCPVKLMPSLMINDKKKNKYADKCISCGLCSYVCPSKIDVREIIEKLKGDKNERV